MSDDQAPPGNRSTGINVQSTVAGNYDAFVCELNPQGSTLLCSTYLGGTGVDAAASVAVDSADNTYIAAYTFSTDWPTRRALQSVYGGNGDGFVALILRPSFLATQIAISRYQGLALINPQTAALLITQISAAQMAASQGQTATGGHHNAW